MHTYIFLPPLKGMTGGVAVLHQVARHLVSGGFPVSVVPREAGTPLPDGVPVCAWGELSLSPDDVWLVPEGWVNALMPGLQAGARTVVYVQNWSYLLSALPEGVHWPQLRVSFLNVSEPVAWFTQQVTGRGGPVLRPGIDGGLFHPSPAKTGSRTTDTPIIAWMPRKNKALAVRIRETFEARRALLGLPAAQWTEIHGLSPQGVADALRRAHIFLATGFPEGCPLPPLEALASGCVLTGFSGMGGWDYMRQALPASLGGAMPWWPLREVPWQGNALVAADADVAAAANGLELAARWLAEDAPELAGLRAQAAATVAEYTVEKQQEAVWSLWHDAAQGTVFRP